MVTPTDGRTVRVEVGVSVRFGFWREIGGKESGIGLEDGLALDGTTGNSIGKSVGKLVNGNVLCLEVGAKIGVFRTGVGAGATGCFPAGSSLGGITGAADGSLSNEFGAGACDGPLSGLLTGIDIGTSTGAIGKAGSEVGPGSGTELAEARSTPGAFVPTKEDWGTLVWVVLAKGVGGKISCTFGRSPKYFL